MKKVHDCWTVVYKEKSEEPRAFSYTSMKEANQMKQMVEDSNGGELIDSKGNCAGVIELEWCYLIEGKIIESITNHSD